MKKINFNKPIILSLLLFVLIMLSCSGLSLIKDNFYLQNIVAAFAFGLLLGIFHEKFAITLDNISKIKISIYYSLIFIILAVPISTFLSYIGAKHHIVPLVMAVVFSSIYLTFGLFLYFGLILGCRICDLNKTDGLKKLVRKDYLLIVLFIVFGVYLYQLYNPMLSNPASINIATMHKIADIIESFLLILIIP